MAKKLQPVTSIWTFKLVEREGELVYIYGHKWNIVPAFQSLSTRKVPVQLLQRKPHWKQMIFNSVSPGESLYTKCLAFDHHTYDIFMMFYENVSYANLTLGEFVSKMFSNKDTP